MKNYITLLSITCLLTLPFYSVSAQTMPIGKDSLVMLADAKVLTLQRKYVELNRIKQSSQGYRLQIHFGNERDKARDIKTKFLQAFPDIPAYDSYQSPNFRVRVGDFRTRLEATKYLKQISSSFPSSFIVSDNIKYPKLIIEN